MKININEDTLKQLQFIFANAAESGKYNFEDFDKFLNDILLSGLTIMENNILWNAEKAFLTDRNNSIFFDWRNMFSEN